MNSLLLLLSKCWQLMKVATRLIYVSISAVKLFLVITRNNANGSVQRWCVNLDWVIKFIITPLTNFTCLFNPVS